MKTFPKFDAAKQGLPAWFVYQTEPLDFFFGLSSLEHAAKDALAMDDGYGRERLMTSLVKQAMEAAYVVSKAKGSYWEGDIRASELYVFGIPDPENHGVRHGFIWKQDNNGTTFIVSPVQIPWLEDSLLVEQPRTGTAGA